MSMSEQNAQVTQALNDPLEREMAAALTAAGIAFLTGDGGENPSGLDFLLPNGVEIEVKQFHSPRIADQMARAANVIAVQGRGALAWLCGLLIERGQMIRELRETTDALVRTRAEPDLVEAADFLCDRLDEIDCSSDDPQEFLRQFYGHIPAPLSRLRMAAYRARAALSRADGETA